MKQYCSHWALSVLLTFSLIYLKNPTLSNAQLSDLITYGYAHLKMDYLSGAVTLYQTPDSPTSVSSEMHMELGDVQLFNLSPEYSPDINAILFGSCSVEAHVNRDEFLLSVSNKLTSKTSEYPTTDGRMVLFQSNANASHFVSFKLSKPYYYEILLKSDATSEHGIESYYIANQSYIALDRTDTFQSIFLMGSGTPSGTSAPFPPPVSRAGILPAGTYTLSGVTWTRSQGGDVSVFSTLEYTFNLLAEAPPIVRMVSSGSNLEVRWPYDSSVWILESSVTLNANSWSKVDGPFAIDGGESVYSFAPTDDHRFFRLKHTISPTP